MLIAGTVAPRLELSRMLSRREMKSGMDELIVVLR
jgi:hypothetical protein